MENAQSDDESPSRKEIADEDVDENFNHEKMLDPDATVCHLLLQLRHIAIAT